MKNSVKLGNIYKLTSGRLAKVIELLPKNRCIIQIEGTFYTQECLRFRLSHEGVTDNYFPTVAGIGFFGNGKYKAFENNRSTRVYTLWTHMLNRCYESIRSGTPSYSDTVVCDEWHNFQNFAEWFYQQKGHNKSGWQLEKDIYYFHTNKSIYSPESCFFVPRSINNQFILREAGRGDLPLGVRTQSGKYYARVQFKNHREHSPTFTELKSAVDWYYEKKLQRLLELAEEFKDDLDSRCYELLITLKLFDPVNS